MPERPSYKVYRFNPHRKSSTSSRLMDATPGKTFSKIAPSWISRRVLAFRSLLRSRISASSNLCLACSNFFSSVVIKNPPVVVKMGLFDSGVIPNISPFGITFFLKIVVVAKMPPFGIAVIPNEGNSSIRSCRQSPMPPKCSHHPQQTELQRRQRA